MAEFNTTIQHNLPQNVALQRMQTLFFENLINEIADKVTIKNLETNWNGNSCGFNFSAKMQKISGELTIKASSIKFSGNLPWMAAAYKKDIENMIWKVTKVLLS